MYIAILIVKKYTSNDSAVERDMLVHCIVVGLAIRSTLCRLQIYETGRTRSKIMVLT